MALRNILYVDSTALDNFVSQIDGYTYEEETIVNSVTDEKAGKAGVGFSKASAEGNLSKQKEESSTKNAKITDASKLDKIIKYLNKEDELKYYESIDESSWKSIYREDFLEVLVTPRLSKMAEITDAARNFRDLAEVFQPFMDKPMIDKKTEDALTGLESLSKLKKDDSLTCVFNFDDNQYPIIAYLDESCLKVTKEKFFSQATMLCKIQRKINKGESVELDEIFSNFKSLATNRKMRRNMPKNLSNPEEFRDKIKGPAFVVIPIAIYQ